MNNHQNRTNRLQIIFLYPSRATINRRLLLLLLPWLMASSNTCTRFPKPSAPPLPYSDPSFLYGGTDILYQDDDLNTEIKVETTNSKEPKTKQEAKQYANNSLNAAEKAITICRKYITDILPKLETKHLALDEAVPPLHRLHNITKNIVARSQVKYTIAPLEKAREKYSKKLYNEYASFDLHLKSATDHLDHAALCITNAKDLGSKNKWSKLDHKRAQLASQLKSITDKRQETKQCKTSKEKKRETLVELFREYLNQIDLTLGYGLSRRNENQIIIQNQ